MPALPRARDPASTGRRPPRQPGRRRLPAKRLPEYFATYDLGRLARRWIFGTDWPGVPGQAQNARAVVGLGLPDDVVPLVLGENARRVYSGLSPAQA